MPMGEPLPTLGSLRNSGGACGASAATGRQPRIIVRRHDGTQKTLKTQQPQNRAFEPSNDGQRSHTDEK